MLRFLRSIVLITVIIVLFSSIPIVLKNVNSPGTTNPQAVSTNTGIGEYMQKITFHEQGLRSGTYWDVDITDATGTVASLNSTSSNIVFNANPGTYNAFFYANGPYISPGTYGFPVRTNSYTLNVTFTDQFPVNITAEGFPPNCTLDLQLNGGVLDNSLNGEGSWGWSSNSNQISKYVVNGTYKASVGEYFSNGGDLMGSIGNITVNGTGVSQTVDFHKATFNVTGLPANVSWGFHGIMTYSIYGVHYPPDKLYPGNPRNVTVYLPAGSTYVLPVAKGYYNPGFYMNITGGNVSRNISFQKEYPVTFSSNFQEIPDGITWYISGVPYTFDGSPSPAAQQSTLKFYLPNGTYSPVVHLSPNYSFFKKYGLLYKTNFTYEISRSSFTVNGNNQTINVTFSVSNKLILSPNMNPTPYVISAAVIIAVGIAANFYVVLRKKK